MSENDIISIIGSLGFPIVVALYLLTQFRKTLDSLKDVISNNNKVMSRICDKLNIKDDST